MKNLTFKVGVTYQGPWRPYVRDFDPTLNTRIKSGIYLPRIELPVYGENSFLSFDASTSVIEDWVLQDDRLFMDFPNRFVLKDENGREWMVIYSYQETKTKPDNREDAAMGFPMGEQHIWSIASMYLLLDEPKNLEEEDLWKYAFIKKKLSNTRDCCALFNREYSWSAGYEAEFGYVEDDEDEYSEEALLAFPASINVLWEEEYDASQDEATSFMIPAGQIIQEMLLYQKKVDGIYYFEDEVAAFDLSIIGNEHKELIIRKDVLDKYIEKTGAKLFWTVVGEKQYFMGGHNQKWQRREGYFIYKKNQIKGSIKIVDNR